VPGDRWYRCVQPPATFRHPFGMRRGGPARGPAPQRSISPWGRPATPFRGSMRWGRRRRVPACGLHPALYSHRPLRGLGIRPLRGRGGEWGWPSPGCAALHLWLFKFRLLEHIWHPCRDAGDWVPGDRWYRCAQPPATFRHPFGMRGKGGVPGDRWYRCAQPPATFRHPFGMRGKGGCRVTGGIAALNHRLPSGIPSGCGGRGVPGDRWYRCAQPPATFRHPFGMREKGGCRVTGGIAALNHRLPSGIPAGGGD